MGIAVAIAAVSGNLGPAHLNPAPNPSEAPKGDLPWAFVLPYVLLSLQVLWSDKSRLSYSSQNLTILSEENWLTSWGHLQSTELS